MPHVPHDVASRLRLALEKSGKTQTQVSRETGVPNDTISRIATRETENPQIATLKKLARSLGVSVGWLLGEPTAQMPLHEAKIVLAAIALARSRLGVTFDTREYPNAVPVGKLRGRRFFRELADLDELPLVDVLSDFARAGAEVVFRCKDTSMMAAGIIRDELVYVRLERSLQKLQGKVIVALLNDSYFIRRLRVSDGVVVLASEDDRFSMVQVEREDAFHPVGVVVGRLADARALALAWEKHS